jgi:hypothetical protein
MTDPLKLGTPASRIDVQILNFVERLYWVLGAFCLYWFTRLEIVDYRMLPLDFPILGSCHASEALIYSLTFFWAPLLLLHQCVHACQRQFGERRQWAGFPGVVGDLPVPRALASVRLMVFIALVVLPTAAYVWSSGRALLRLNLHWSNERQGRMAAWQSLGQWGPPQGEPAHFWIFTGGWSWEHKDIEWRERTLATGAKEPRPVSISAFPGIQPAFFLLMDVVLLASLSRIIYYGVRCGNAPPSRPVARSDFTDCR